MAEFCSLCAERMKLDHADFDVRAIAQKLKIGFGQDVVCEGCSMITILKEDDSTRAGKGRYTSVTTSVVKQCGAISFLIWFRTKNT